jgi:hypothetical protein
MNLSALCHPHTPFKCRNVADYSSNSAGDRAGVFLTLNRDVFADSLSSVLAQFAERLMRQLSVPAVDWRRWTFVRVVSILRCSLLRLFGYQVSPA